MLRLFGAFPAGWQGAGLLLLRTVVGVTAAFEGGALVQERSAAPLAWVVCLVLAGAGLAMVIGTFTPISSALVVILNGLQAVHSLGLPTSEFFENKPAIFFVVIMSITAMLLGPGAFSLDARMFGRREIVIPRTPPSAKP